MRKAFTLIEMLISVVILSIMMLFLYQSYSSLNRSNIFYKEKADDISTEQIKKRVMYLDFALALHGSVQILNQSKTEDVIFMQSSNSIHKRHNPYITYFINDNKLYRLESLNKIPEYPLSSTDEYEADYIGEVQGMRVYQTAQKEEDTVSQIYLLHVDFVQENDILMKIKVLNDY